MQLEGKTALVTGAGGGIGRVTAVELAKAGAAIAVTDLDQRAVEETRAEVESLGRQVMSAQTDIGDLSSIDAMVNNVVGEFGHIDIVVNNAGVTRHGARFDITEETWDLMQRINAKGTFFACKASLNKWCRSVDWAIPKTWLPWLFFLQVLAGATSPVRQSTSMAAL